MRLFDHPVQPEDTDERYTPPWLFEGMAETFDMDVAAPAGGVPWIPALEHYSADVDGLSREWRGLVWCNPPFSNATPWAQRFVEHANGVWLGPISANASWLQRTLMPAVRVIWLPYAFPFVHPTHTGRFVPVAVMVTGLGLRGEAAIERLAASGRHPGTLWRQAMTGRTVTRLAVTPG
jgi:hypothetical protein